MRSTIPTEKRNKPTFVRVKRGKTTISTTMLIEAHNQYYLKGRKFRGKRLSRKLSWKFNLKISKIFWTKKAFNHEMKSRKIFLQQNLQSNFETII